MSSQPEPLSPEPSTNSSPNVIPMSGRRPTETPPLLATSAETTTGFENIRRSRQLRTYYPRMTRLCPPTSERLWFLGGRPGHGKTALAWNLAVDMATRGQRVLFVSLEQTTAELAIQAASRFSRIPLDRLYQAHNADSGVLLTDEEQGRIDAAVAKIASLDLWLRMHGAEQHGRSIESVLRSATRARFDGIFVDHIGMLGRGGRGSDIDMLPRSIDAMRGLCRGEVVKGYRPFVCCTSPLNRDCERDGDSKAAADRIPRLSDFRGSGLIESDADLAMIVRKRQRVVGDDDTSPDLVDGFVLKNRQGRSPLVLLFEMQGAINTVIERRPDEPQAAPSHWSESGE